MKLTKLIFQAAAISAFAMSAVAAHADTLDNIRQAKKIRIAIDLALPPAGMIDDKMQPTGSDVETARLLAQDLGVAMEIVPTIGTTRIPNLQNNKADIVISTLAVTPDRKKVIDFSVPYAVQLSLVAGLKNLNIKNFADLTGKSVSVTRGTIQDTDLTRGTKGANIVRYEDDATLLTAVTSGQADILGTSLSLVNSLNKINEKNASRQVDVKFIMGSFDLAIGVRKNDPELLEWVNNWVRTNLKNGKLNDIYKKYYGVNLTEDIINGKH
jgi:polar amino acid transport system substrate-binding protein